MTQDKKFGKLILPYGVDPEDHERDTADTFLLLGFDVDSKDSKDVPCCPCCREKS